MASSRTQNALLFVIAACLVLIVVHLYSGHLVAQAQAAPAGKASAAPNAENPPDPNGMHLYGESCESGGGKSVCTWTRVRVNKDGVLLYSSIDPVSKAPQDVHIYGRGHNNGQEVWMPVSVDGPRGPRFEP
ncbi:MAG TPA: hypothetical protein VGS22_29165 [Thermoanaerobaculia bacterium]|jgi:hypothetical protein|nr:hypothetical protein [Thermoanaerobaculia bacterium]